MSGLDHLSMELILLILKQVDQRDLYACALVSRQWYAVANPLLWRSLMVKNVASFTNIHTTLTESNHAFLQHHIQSINFGCTLSTPAFEASIRYAGYPRFVLARQAPHVTNNRLRPLLQRCQNLSFFGLGWSPITQSSMITLGQHCRQLRSLHLQNCRGLGCAIFPALAACRLLEEITVIGCRLDGMRFPRTAEATANVLVGFDRLTRLKLDDPPNDFSQCLLGPLTSTSDADSADDDTDDDMPTIVTWPRLVHLWLNRCEDIGDMYTIAFVRTHPHLQSLYVYGGRLTDATLRTMMNCLPGIVDVGLVGNFDITHRGVRRLVQNCPALIWVQLFGCDIATCHFPEAGPSCLDEDLFYHQGIMQIRKENEFLVLLIFLWIGTRSF
ncbi:hypothetical protein BCR42DRAFT_397415 [Absidia repens]|uniref:F-box domain-containing protein n=1 Tax=Absidia repens TaxID=90262 RepID=A0A1X2I1E6_9FUNG|nr:hypothetical protein BCR42DRAFT_397415 [Absidia repens]